MSALRAAAGEYLAMRRALGFNGAGTFLDGSARSAQLFNLTPRQPPGGGDSLTDWQADNFDIIRPGSLT